MNTNNGEYPLPTVTENEADDATRRIFQDIKATMGVALVNLVWRHLATSPRVLAWSWQLVKPYYTNQAVPSAAWILRESIKKPELAAISTSEWAQAGVEIRHMMELDAVLHTYERGNAQNLIAMCYLQAGLANDVECISDLAALNESQRHAEQSDRVIQRIPPLPDWDTLDSGITSTIKSMTDIWVPSQYRGFSPSVFRHISHWPGSLQLFCSRLEKNQRTSPTDLDSGSQKVIAHARELARRMGPVPVSAQSLSDDDQLWLKSTLALFIDGMISRGVVIIPAMRELLVASE